MRRPGGIVTRSFSTAASAPRPSPQPVTTSAPTPQFRQHHHAEAPQIDAGHFRQGWRVATRLDGLLEAGRIDTEQLQAAQEWRRWAEIVTPTRVQAWDVRVDASLVANDTGMIIRVNAQAKLRSAAAALGPLRHRLLELSLRDDRSWREIGDRLGVDGKTATRYVIEAVAALADHLAGRDVAEPPVIRFRNQPGRQ
jgi:hypothetical protein